MTAFNFPTIHLVKLLRCILMIAMVVVISMSMVVPVIGQDIDDNKKSTTITDSHKIGTKDSENQKGDTGGSFFKGLIIVLILIIAAVVFWLCAPFLSIFQSKGSPDEIIEKMGCEEGGPK